MKGRRRFVVLPFAIISCGLSSCGARADDIVLASQAAGPDQGGLLVAFSPTASTFDAEQARLAAGGSAPAVSVLVDGERAMVDDGAGHLSRLGVIEGGTSALGYLDAGPHHFTVATADGAPMFEGDAEVPGGGTLRLFLYGPLGAPQGLFVAAPDSPAAGNEHLTVVNLVRTGQLLEVVTCAGAACVPVSPPLVLGGVFDAEAPAASDHPTSTLTPDGDGIGYRVVPSAWLPDPPVLALSHGPLTAGSATDGSPAPAIFVAAPVYLSDGGELQDGFN